MVTSALLCFSRADEFLHSLEDSVSPSHVFVEEVVGVELEEPVVFLVFIKVPVSSMLPLYQSFRALPSLLNLLFLLFFTGISYRFAL